MIGKAIMLAGTSCLAATFFIRRQEEFYKQLFADLQKCPKYHTDYVQEAATLPLNQYLILFGPPHSLGNSPIISPSFIAKSPEPDRFWKLTLKDPFEMRTATNEPIEVKSQPDIYAFNLPPTSRELKDPKFEERAVLEGVGVCVYGKINNLSGKYSIVPQILIGNKHESMLSYLDGLIVKSSNRGKATLVVGGLLLGGHWIYHYLNPTKSEVEVEMESQ